MTKTKLLVMIMAICIVGGGGISAYAQEVTDLDTQPHPATGILATIFTSEVVLISFVVVAIGIGAKAVRAYWKDPAAFDKRRTGSSLILGFLVSLQLVSNSVQHFPIDASPEVYFGIIIGEILTVMAVDSEAKKIGGQLKKKISGGDGQTV